MEFLTTHNLLGLTIGIATFIIIGLFHPLVIKAEYYLGTKSWWLFLFFGIAGIFAAVLIDNKDNILLSALFGVFSFSCFWSILEIFEQKKRVEKGWFPENPKRKVKNNS